MKRVLTLAIIGLAAATTAQADDHYRGWSIGAAAVFSDYQLDNKAIDDSAIGVKLSGQYRFNRYLGIEGAYLNSGEFKEEVAEGSGAFDSDAELTVDGFSLSLVGYLPLPSENIDVFAKLGYFDVDQELEVGDAMETRGADGLTFGAGTRISMSERFGIRAELDWYELDDGADFWTVNLGVDYRFGGSR